MSLPPHTPSPRSLGRYRVLAELGRGGMGVVYRAVDETSGTVVALKVLLAAEHAAPGDVERFIREAALVARLEHPNIVRVRDHGWSEGRPYLAMDLVDGPSLETTLAREGALSPIRAARIAAGVARGLQAAHEAGLVHRDIKPANILIEDSSPRITDFGLARELADSSRLTATGQVLGTPAYMAPEQATNRVLSAPLADQYSLGAVLYEMLAGRPPYRGDSAVEVMVAVVSGPPTPLDEVVRGVPAPLAHIVDRAMARDPRQRFPECRDLADDLERFARGESIRARPLPVWVRWQSRLRPMLPYVVGVAATLVGAVGVSRAIDLVRDVRAEQVEALRRLDAERAATRAIERASEALLASGPDAAARILDAYGDVYPGTPAVPRAWLAHADRLEAAGAYSAAVDAAARAYTTAAAAEEQDLALLALAEQFQRRWDWGGLAAVVETLDRRHPGRVADPQLASHRAAAQLAWGDWRGASETLDVLGVPAPTDAFRDWAHRVDAPAGLPDLEPVDVDGDGAVEQAMAVEGRLQFVRLADGFPVVVDEAHPMPHAVWSRALPGGRWVGFSERDGIALYTRAGDGAFALTARHATTSSPTDALLADLDRDGEPSVYVGLGAYERRLLVAEGDAFVDAVPTSRSDVMDLLTDGEAMWVSTGAWYAYDVRRFVHGDAGGLERTARRRIGWVPRLARLADGRIAAAHGAQFPTLVGFPADAPTGWAPGVWLLDGESLDPTDVLPIAEGVRPLGLLAADLDADGREDLVLSARRDDANGALATLVWAGGTRGFVGPYILGGVAIEAVHQLDEDPALEAIARTAGPSPRTVIFGLGAATPTAATASRIEPAPVPPEVRGPAAASWARAEELVAMGLTREAADALLRLVDHLPPEAGDLAAWRAAALLELRGDRAEAAAIFSELATRVPGARERAAAHWYAVRRFPEAVTMGMDIPWLADERQVTLIDGASRDPSWTDTGDGYGGAEGLVWQPVSRGPELGGAELTWGGRHLSLELDLTVRRLEWGSGLEVRVGSLAFGVRGWGGGGLLEREVGCFGEDEYTLRAPVPGPTLGERWLIRVDVYDGEVVCEVQGPHGQTRWERRTLPVPPAVADVRVLPANHAPGGHMLADVVIHRLAVAGARVTPVTLAPAEPSIDVQLRRLAPSVALDLVAARGQAALPVALSAFEGLRHAHSHDALTRRVFTADLAPLLALDLAGADDATRQAASELWLRRAQAWAQDGQLALAAYDLRRAAEELDRAGVDAGELRFEVELGLAASEATRDPEAARRHLDAARAAHPLPDLAEDLIRARSDLGAILETWL